MVAARQPIVFPDSTAAHLRSFAQRVRHMSDSELDMHADRWHDLAMRLGTLDNTPGVTALFRLVCEECDILEAEQDKRPPYL